MSRDVSPPLGGLSARGFLEGFWQKRPLLLRAAFPDFQLPLDPAELRRLATREGVRSRLVTLSREQEAATARSGPFTAAELAALPAHDWSLLVHEVDRHVGAVAELLERFRFIPNWRIDDAMISLAPDGGGVGPHVDRYDVFLLQGRGRRRWRIREAPPTGRERPVPGAVSGVLADVEFDQEFELDPGDMLYLPPGIPHDGIALGECMTCSIGFRAPDPRELCAGFLTQLSPAVFESLRYADPDLLPAADPGEIPALARERLRRAAAGLFAEGGDFERWIGCYVTRPLRDAPRPAAPVVGSAAELRALLERGAELERSAPPHFAWFGDEGGVWLFVGGESYRLAHGAEPQARLLCGRRRLESGSLLPWLEQGLFAGIVIDLLIRGYLRIGDPTPR